MMLQTPSPSGEGRRGFYKLSTEMKQLLYSIRHKAYSLALTAALAVGVTSCNTVWDNDDCGTEYRVKFKYDYNMLFTDAFPTQVPSVTLYAFDKDGQLVFQQSEEGEALAADDYYMTLDVDPGEYRLVAWAGLTGVAGASPQAEKPRRRASALICAAESRGMVLSIPYSNILKV